MAGPSCKACWVLYTHRMSLQETKNVKCPFCFGGGVMTEPWACMRKSGAEGMYEGRDRVEWARVCPPRVYSLRAREGERSHI